MKRREEKSQAAAMPERTWGIGTGYVGRSDVRTDDSFITTVWFTILWIPIFPRASYRVWPVDFGEIDFKFKFELPLFKLGWSREYQVLEKVPLNIKQVIKGYGITAIIGLLVLKIIQ